MKNRKPAKVKPVCPPEIRKLIKEAKEAHFEMQAALHAYDYTLQEILKDLRRYYRRELN